MWPEVEVAKNENRRELVLSGPSVGKRIIENGLDNTIFELTNLNYLNINEAGLDNVPDEVAKLVNLQTLVLHSNKLEKFNSMIAQLEKLKMLDLSRNLLTEIPSELEKLVNLDTLVLAGNKIEKFPKLLKHTKLNVLDLSNNQLSAFPDICHSELTNLADLKLHGNTIDEIPSTIMALHALKNFDISSNKITVIPGELANCGKLKEVNLKNNPIADRRLLKLIDQQSRPKQIIDYVRQHCPKTMTDNNKPAAKGAGKRNKKNSKDLSDDEGGQENEGDYKYSIKVQHASPEFRVVLDASVKGVREHFVGCLVHNLKFDDDTFRKFIQLQNKLHEGVCDKRNAATIATHDFQKLPPGNLTYSTLPPNELFIVPLNETNQVTGAQLFSSLQARANQLRKEKKRNTYSGIHKYLYLIEGKSKYPCILNDKREVISFPPITNSNISRIEPTTTTIFVEVTSTVSQFICKTVLDTLLKDMVLLFETDLTVEQVRCTDIDGNLKTVYPSKTDLSLKDGPIRVVRE